MGKLIHQAAQARRLGVEGRHRNARRDDAVDALDEARVHDHRGDRVPALSCQGLDGLTSNRHVEGLALLGNDPFDMGI